VLLSLVAAGAIWFLAADLTRRAASTETASVSDQVAPPVVASRRIKATLFYVAPDGVGLVPVERDVLFGEGTLEQAKRILEAQFENAPSSLTSAIPAGTKLRGVYLTDHGEAYVDLTGDAAAAHPGGSLNELLTVYTIVEALTANLPALNAVQISWTATKWTLWPGTSISGSPRTRRRWVEPLQPAQPAGQPVGPDSPESAARHGARPGESARRGWPVTRGKDD